MTACPVVSAECKLFPHLLAPGFCTAWQDSRDFFRMFFVLALLVVKPLEEEVLLGWGKVCHVAVVPPDLSLLVVPHKEKQAVACIHAWAINTNCTNLCCEMSAFPWLVL